MAGENYTLPEVPVYREAIRKILNEDPVNAEEILNPLVQALLENIHFVKLLAEQKAENSALDAHTGDDTAHLTAEERTVWNGKAAGDHSHTAADVGAIPTSQKGAANGVASLGTDAKVPKAQLPASEGKRTARFTVGTSAAGWTADQVDYLCDGTADQVEINAAITALPATGGEVVILDGTYNLTGVILVNKNNVTLSGNGNSTKLVRAFSGSITEPGMIYVTSSNNTIKYLQLDGVKDTYSGSNNSGIYLYGSPNNTIIWNTCNNNNNNGIYLYNSDSNTITGNTCNINNANGIYLYSNNNNTITGNTCIRITGTSADYTSDQNTISVTGNNNLIVGNNIMGKNYTNSGTGNTFANNKYAA